MKINRYGAIVSKVSATVEVSTMKLYFIGFSIFSSFKTIRCMGNEVLREKNTSPPNPPSLVMDFNPLKDVNPWSGPHTWLLQKKMPPTYAMD